MRNRIVLALTLCQLANLGELSSQTSNVPEDPRSLVVAVQGYFLVGGAPEQGAGIILGTRADTLYIVTAGHVVQRNSVAQTVLVRFVCGDTLAATVRQARRDSLDLDLAVLSVTAEPAQLRRCAPRSWDREGDVGKLRSEALVRAVGCPFKQCWGTSAAGDRLIGKDASEILFQSPYVGRGMSGGALFNATWEVVGMVIKHDPGRSAAIRIGAVSEWVRAVHLPVTLRRPAVPRAGYRTTIGGVVLTSTSTAPEAFGEPRLPSGRASLMRQISPVLNWHLAALRVAPENLAVTAGMVGLSLCMKIGRFWVLPFAEAGFGHQEARFDRGGYYISTTGGTQYVPSFERVTGDGLGAGAGMSLQAVLLPPVIFEVTAGYWSFTRPQNAPKLTNVFVGGGVRLGL